MQASKINVGIDPWSDAQKLWMKFFTLYFGLQVLPLDWKFYKTLFSINWTYFTIDDLLHISSYMPQFFSMTGIVNWGIPFMIAVVGTTIWTIAEKREINYDLLYYWLRVILRYRLAIGIISYGLIKIFPLQMPYPSLSNLHSNYGDFLPWKIYWHTIGITQGYEIFLGFGEVLAGILLLFRKTVPFAAAFIIGFTGNVVLVNFAYDAGELVYSLYLLVIAVFLFAYDAPRLYRLLFLQKYTVANKFHPGNTLSWMNKLRYSLQIFLILYFLLVGYLAYSNFRQQANIISQEPVLTGAYGFYDVETFVLNNDTIPYSTNHPERWQNVVFEKWATVSIKIARPVHVDLSTRHTIHTAGTAQSFESAGVGGRHYFSYSTDTLHHQLNFKNKNKFHQTESYQFQYFTPSEKTIVVKGVNEKKDSIYAILKRIDRKHLLYVGRRKPIKL